MATVVFFTPHQDDETLSMGPAVRDHLNAGHDVHVVLMTTGQNSAVQPGTGLSVADFIAAHDDELLRATRQVGVRTANVHISDLRTQDGQLTQAAAEAIIQEFYTSFPGAWCKSYSQLNATGRHADHVACGQAAVALYQSGVITNLRLYVEPWLISTWRTTNPTVTATAETVSDNTSVLRGFDQYKVVDHTAFMYGIGYLSVGPDWDADRPHPTSYYHLPPS